MDRQTSAVSAATCTRHKRPLTGIKPNRAKISHDNPVPRLCGRLRRPRCRRRRRHFYPVFGSRHAGGTVCSSCEGCLAGRCLTKRSPKSCSECQQRIKAHRNKAAICARKDRCDGEAGYVKGHAPDNGSAPSLAQGHPDQRATFLPLAVVCVQQAEWSEPSNLMFAMCSALLRVGSPPSSSRSIGKKRRPEGQRFI